MKHLVVASWLLALVSRSRDPTVVVTVDSSRPRPSRCKRCHTCWLCCRAGIDPGTLPSPTPSALTLLLQLPSGFGGDLGVSVAAFDQPGQRGCLLASGVVRRRRLAPDETLRAPLFPVSDAGACRRTAPVRRRRRRWDRRAATNRSG